MAAGAESLSEHPIGRAVVERAQELGLATEGPREFRSIAGLGIGAMYERDGGREWIYVGSERLFMGGEVDLSAAICVGGGGGSSFRRLQKEGKTVMLVVRRGVGGGGGGACGKRDPGGMRAGLGGCWVPGGGGYGAGGGRLGRWRRYGRWGLGGSSC